MNELRLLFAGGTEGGYTLQLVPGGSGGGSEPVPFRPFLDGADFDDLRWYLEEFMDLPDGGSIVRARRIEQALDTWGRQLYDAVFCSESSRGSLAQLRQTSGARTLTIATSDPAILRLPWELMADAAGALCFQGISIRRQLQDTAIAAHRPTKLPLRILLVVSRPVDLGFIDPRLTSASLLAALKPLGNNAIVDFVRPPTLSRLQEMLADAERQDQPYHILHFDGHGTFLPEIEIGALCFEQPDSMPSAESRTDHVTADRLGQLLANHRIPLVVLEACRTGQLGKVDVFRAVAPRLIQAGVGSVISMNYAVHVEAAHVFLERFYQQIVVGATVGQALEQGRAKLLAEPARWVELGPKPRTVTLQDWFLPHLYQRGDDQPILPPAPPLPDKFDVFLSHNSADKPRVERLALLLKNRHGLRVWFDAWEVQRGLLHEQCVDGVRKSRVTLIACTKAALESKWVTNEKNWAYAAGRAGNDIVPLRFEEVELPLDLAALARVDFLDPSRDAEQAAEIARLVGQPLDAAKRETCRAPAGGSEPGAFPSPPRYGFQGRACELYQLERQFRRHRAILLHAMGGMGKTALATEAAHWWTRTGLFPDGACFISFERFASAERVIRVLGTYLEGSQFNSLSEAEQRRRAKDLFEQKRILVVWDNFESVLPQFQTDAVLYSDAERQRLFDLFADWTSDEGHGRLLVTCRPAETGLASARPAELQGLARPDSLWLLVRVLEKCGVDADAQQLDRERLSPLLDLVQDHPLSIELVGPHLKRLTPEAICADFGRLLKEFQVDAGKERNESLLASLAFSTRRLSDAAQAALPWLGLFSGGVFEDNLLDMVQMDLGQWHAVRTELEAVALVRVDHGIRLSKKPYIHFHPTLAEAIAPTPLLKAAETRRRFVRVYLSVAIAVENALGGQGPGNAMRVMSLEEANLRTAVRLGLEEGCYAEVSSIGHMLTIFLERAGRLRERDSWLAWLRTKSSQDEITDAAVLMEEDEAWSLCMQGRGGEAASRLDRLIGRLRSARGDIKSAAAIASVQRVLARVLCACGRHSEALPVSEESVKTWESLLARAKRSGETGETELNNLGTAMTDLVNALRNTGRLDDALEAAQRMLSIAQELGNRREVAGSQFQIAKTLVEQGRYRDADFNYEEALQTARSIPDPHLEALVLQNQSIAAAALGQRTRAARLAQSALNRFLAMNNEAEIMRTYGILGGIEFAEGRAAEAKAWYERSYEVAQRRGDTVGVSAAAWNIGVASKMMGEAASQRGDGPTAKQHFAEAKRSIEAAVELMRQLENEPLLARALGQLASVHLRLEELDEAQIRAHEAREIFERLGSNELCSVYDCLVNIAHARGDTAQAAAWEHKRAAALNR